jgi:opacity protein-like surface antigen
MDRAAMIRSLLLTVAALGAALPAAAQTPRIEVSGGYQFLNVSADLESIDTGDVPVRNVDQSLPIGWYVDLAGNLNRHLSVVFAAGGNYKSMTESATFGGLSASASVDLKVHEFMGGVRYSVRANPTVVPFGQFLVGAINGSAKVTASASVVGSPGFSFSGEASGTDVALQAGGGMQLRLADNFGVRVGADYIRILSDDGVNAFRFAAGVVFAR